jgi:hypothetical protein
MATGMAGHGIISSLLDMICIGAFGLFRIKVGGYYPVSWCLMTQDICAERLLTFLPLSKLEDYLYVDCL